MTGKRNQLPKLTGEERARALELAAQARRRYAALKERVKSGTLSLTDAMGTRGGGTSGSWFPGEPETPQERHGKGCGGTPFSMPFLLSH